ncbi:ABC transporter permease [Haloechinothrix sp. LS1_15]|uniref:ABC transporter permease n=1 Tax=Haloechinothrix sp. LS1_15 TaxID=2652248 RepID=UPI002947ABCA|nr:ABC transporter permease [Haloechinothrix sp. LS1_15]MDV6014678.1 ABC transporter permease [Haloechinothrix sp. LS1_15]
MTADVVARGTRSPAEPLAATGALIRLILRRDRIRLGVWIGAIAGFTVLFAAALPGVYADESERQARAALIGNPGVRAFAGPGYGLDDYTFGAMLAQEYLSFTAIFVALMAFLLVARYTRVEEETGRAELVRAGVVGRHAHATAALVVVGGAGLTVGALIAIGLGSLGMEGATWPSSWLFGMSLASIGLVFAAIAALTAQLTEHGRGAAGLAGALFAGAYLVRAAGDMAEVGGGWLSWFSPIGWAQQTRVYVADRWWPLLLSVALTVMLAALAYWLSTRRDLAAALRRPRPGPATASRWLSGPFRLAARLHRASVLWWSAGVFLFALGYGSLAGEVERFITELATIDEWIAGIGGQTMIESFLGVIVLMIAVAVAAFAILTVQRPAGEEGTGRVEPVLAAATSRTRWLGSHVAVALAGSALLMLLGGLGLGLSASAALGDPEIVPKLIRAGLVYLPAIWLTVATAVALFGLSSRAVGWAWVIVAYSGVIVIFGDLLGLPDWVVRLSPFGHTPLLPAEDLRWAPLVWLTVLAAALLAAGLVAFRRRDVAAT